jgi:hypothetical protein
MKWYRLASQKEIEGMRNQNVHQEQEPFRIEIKPCSSVPITEMGVIAQMYIAPFEFVSEQSCIQLPIGNELALELARQQLVVHFRDYKEVLRGDKVVHLILANLREESAAFFRSLHESGKLSAQVTDVYRSKEKAYDPLNELGKRDVYKLETDQLRYEPDQEAAYLWKFLENTTLAVEGHATFSPIGWRFDEGLLDSAFLGAMSRECEEIYLFVDPKTSEVRTVTGLVKQ